MHSVLLTSAVFVAIAHATPTLQKRNACDWQDVEPILYHKYGTNDCPPKVIVDAEGNCPAEWQGYDPGCVGFCEQTTEYKYGREFIFLANPYCHGPMSCAISDTVTVAFTLSFTSSLSVKFTDALTAGITGGRSKTTSEAHAQTKSIALKDGECGYFTFIPIIKQTCGAWTEVDTQYPWGDPVCHPETLTTKNVCAEQPTKRPGFGDQPAGDTIFVRVDCSNHKPLDPKFQDPAYQHDGVPLRREEYEEVTANFFPPKPKDPPPPPPVFEDFNCSCGESGCSKESAGCCANGSCQCKGNKENPNPEDPTCCAKDGQPCKFF